MLHLAWDSLLATKTQTLTNDNPPESTGSFPRRPMREVLYKELNVETLEALRRK